MNMAFSSWICSKSTKNMFLKIVHPGGHVELHDRPLLAAEIIYRNPRCVVAHPHVFQQPWAVVAPETELTLGQKFYVVPISTIRKLQRLSNKYSPSPATPTSESPQSRALQDPDNDNSTRITCWFFTNKNVKAPYYSLKHSLNDEDSNSSANSADACAEKGVQKNKSSFACMITGVKSSDDHHHKSDDSAEKTRSPGHLVSAGDDQTQVRTKKRGRCHAKGSPKRHAAFDQWQPSLASITEAEE